MVETTDASKTAEDVRYEFSHFTPDAAEVFFLKTFNFIQFFYPSSDFLSCQILPEETHMQEQESNSLLIENDPAIADIQTVDSPVQHTTDGKKVICLVYFSTTNMN